MTSIASFAAAEGLELPIRYRDILRELKNQRIRNATERLANWLLTERSVAHEDEFALPISRALLAARLGMTAEHLSRSFAQLREHGVTLKGSKIGIDATLLEDFAKPSRLLDGTDI